MIYIKSDLIIKPVRGSLKWELVEDWHVSVGGTDLVVNGGFQTDFASVPRSAWLMCPPATGKYRQPAVLHDWMYVNAYGNKLYADTVFLNFMRIMGVNPVKRELMYYAVRFFGKGNY